MIPALSHACRNSRCSSIGPDAYLSAGKTQTAPDMAYYSVLILKRSERESKDDAVTEKTMYPYPDSNCVAC